MHEHILDRSHHRPELRDPLAQPARDLAQPLLHAALDRRRQHAALDIAQLAIAFVDDAVAAHPATGVEPKNSHAPPYSRGPTLANFPPFSFPVLGSLFT